VSEICHSDAAYVVGALSPADRAEYEEHLRGCERCRESVSRLAGLPGLLALTTPEDIEQAGPPVPATLLPGLLARVAAARRHRRWVLAGVLAAAVAVVVALPGTLVQRTPDDTAGSGAAATSATATTTAPSPTPQPAVLQPMTQVLAGPMNASLELVDKRWGTAITVVCQYDETIDRSVAYDLTVIDTDGHLNSAGSWSSVPGASAARVETATAVPRDRIASLEVRLPDGRTILRSGP
jgi:hypothetical protein